MPPHVTVLYPFLPPDYPPYGGEYDDPMPHLTVGHDRPVELLRSAAAEVEPQ